MWMMGYNESHEDHMMMNMNMVESYTHNNGGSRKLRPLVPRPPPPATCSATSFNRFHHDHHHHRHHHHQQQQHSAVEQNKREFNAQQMVVVSSRWNPTPEQLQTLEELYRRGTRTPSAEEIQHITAQLRRFGKIEGKNVFYWFQNHKARERQKRRRQLDINPANSKDHLQPPAILSNPDINSINLDHHHPHSIQRKQDSEVIEETRNWAIPTFSEKNVVRERSRKADHQGWIIQPHEEQEQQQEYEHEHEHEEDEDEGRDLVLLHGRRRKGFPAARTTATWNDMMQCLSSSSSTSDQLNNIAGGSNTTTCNPTTTALTVSPFASKTTSSSVVVSSNQSDYETLELFPVNCSSEQPEKCFVQGSDVNFSPRQFIEFLPLKN